jgi:hypothetical protein
MILQTAVAPMAFRAFRTAFNPAFRAVRVSKRSLISLPKHAAGGAAPLEGVKEFEISDAPTQTCLAQHRKQYPYRLGLRMLRAGGMSGRLLTRAARKVGRQARKDGRRGDRNAIDLRLAG